MPSTDTSRLMNSLRMRLPGALDDAIRAEYFSTVNEFFQGSNLWQTEITLSVTPGTLSYTITPPSGAVVRLVALVNGGGFPVDASMEVPGTIDLYFDPNVAQTYTATVVLTVDDPVDGEGYPAYPSWVLNKYGNEILDGVLGRMMTQLGKPYSNQQLGIYHLRRFQSAISQAKVEAQHKNLYRGQAWRFPRTFTRIRRR